MLRVTRKISHRGAHNDSHMSGQHAECRARGSTSAPALAYVDEECLLRIYDRCRDWLVNPLSWQGEPRASPLRATGPRDGYSCRLPHALWNLPRGQSFFSSKIGRANV